MNFQEVLLKSLTEQQIYEHLVKHEPLIHGTQQKSLKNGQEFFSFDFEEMISTYRDRFIYITNYWKNLGNPEQLHVGSHFFVDMGGFFLTYNAFYSTIMMLGDEEQTKYWKEQVLNTRVIGCYAQTELAHGSDVQGLETQAHYEKETKTWRMVSPRSSSSKAWSGLLGIWSTHCVLQAQAFVDGKNIGVQTFVIPIRDPATLKPFSGVNVGDQGAKLGFMQVDNGVMMFKDYRIPQNSMLMRYVKVSDEGKVSVQGGKSAIKFGYGSMLNLRVKLVQNFVYFALSGTMKTYRILKHNGGLTDLNKFRIGTEISTHLSFLMSSRKLRRIYNTYQTQLANKSDEVLNTLAELHILCAGFKAVSGWNATHTIGPNLARASVGYFNSSSMPFDYSGCIPVVTYEGDNNVLLQQTAKYLLKLFDDMRKGRDLSPTFQFFNTWAFKDTPDNFFFNSAADFELADNFERALEFFAVCEAQNTAVALAKRVSEKQSHIKTILNEEFQSDLISMSQKFICTMNFKFFRETIEKDNLDSQAKEVLGLLLRMYGITLINDNLPFFIANKAISHQEGRKLVEMGVQNAWKKIEPNFEFVIQCIPYQIDNVMSSIDFTQNKYLDEKAPQLIKHFQPAPQL